MNNKGLSEYVAHILGIAIALVILGVVASSMYNYYTDIAVESQESEARTISEEIGGKILDLYTGYSSRGATPKNGSSITLATAEIDTPEKVGGSSYEIRLNASEPYSEGTPAKIIIVARRYPEKKYEYNLYNIEIGLKGKVRSPEGVTLHYIRENINGNITDRIRMVRS